MSIELIRVTARDYYGNKTGTYTVRAEEVHDFNATDPNENVAWNGCARIMRDQKGNYYYGGLSGRSGDTWKYWKIDTNIAKLAIKENDINIIAEYL